MGNGSFVIIMADISRPPTVLGIGSVGRDHLKNETEAWRDGGGTQVQVAGDRAGIQTQNEEFAQWMLV